jgi:hypothetical protein
MRRCLASGILLALTACPAPPAADEPVPAPQPSQTVVLDDVRIGSNGALDNFQVARADVDVGDDAVARATLVVDLRTTCFPFSQWADEPPPPGQNWPASCDAFDRNFHFLLDDPADDAVDDTVVPLELVRAITPFGGPLHLEVDVTDVVNGLVRSGRGGVHRLSAHITTFSDGAGIVSGSDGGWNVSARLDLEPGTPARNVVDVRALFFGNLVTGAEATAHEVTLAPGQRGLLVTRTTGHGGPNSDGDCFGPAEEFCRREHGLRLAGGGGDEVRDITFIPLREDCADLCTLTTSTIPGGGTIQHCAENPTGAIESVRAPRANWCPGSVTPPFESSLNRGDNSTPHEIAWSVERIAEGGSWLTSLAVVVSE